MAETKDVVETTEPGPVVTTPGRPGPHPAPQARGVDPEAPTFEVDELIADRYRVVRFLARGGMGEVYEVEDIGLRERVALKTVLPEIARDEAVMARFRREIQLARKVTHPNICRMFDLGYHKTGSLQIAFLTMELLPGESLASWIASRGRISLAEARPIIAQLTAGLGAAHGAGVIHRDFKSPNVMMVGDRVVITDFGLARSSSDTPGNEILTASGMLMGSPAYMAPEQVTGHPVTPATDLYALGIVMYEMAAGRRPFVGDSAMAVAAMRLSDDPPPLDDVDPTWAKVIMRCLARAPADRYATASAVVEALLDSQVEQPTPRESAGPKRSRPRWLWALAIVAVIAAVTVWMISRSDREPIPAVAPAPARSPLQRASDLMDLADLPAAVKVLEQARTAEPTNPLVLERLAVLYSMLGREADARTAVRRAMELTASLDEADRLRVTATFDLFNCVGARESLLRLRELRPDDRHVHIDLAIAYQLCDGDALTARKVLADARLRPSLASNPHVDALDGELAMFLGRHQEGIDVLERAARTAADRGAPLHVGVIDRLLALAHTRLARFDRAIEHGERARNTLKGSGLNDAFPAALVLGTIYMDVGQVARARQATADAVEIARTFAERESLTNALTTFAWIAAEAGDQAASRAALSEAGREPALTAAAAVIRIRAIHALASRGDMVAAARELSLLDERHFSARAPIVELAITKAKLAFAADRLADTRTSLVYALGELDAMHRDNHAARLRLELAALELEEGHLDAARTAARSALAELERERLPLSYRALAHCRLAEIALASGDLATARAQRDLAVNLDAEAGVPRIHLEVRRLVAAVRIAGGVAADVEVARGELAAVIRDADKAGFADLSLQTQLVLLQTTKPIDRAQLEVLVGKATTLGLKRLVRHARTAASR